MQRLSMNPAADILEKANYEARKGSVVAKGYGVGRDKQAKNTGF